MSDLELEKAKALALDLSVEDEAEEEVIQEDGIETSPGEAFTRSAADMVAFGFADEAEAAIDTAADVIVGDTSFKEVSNQYNANLDVARQEFAQNAEDHPLASGVGTAAGIVGSMFTGGALTKAVGIAGKGVVGAMKVGAAESALFGLGSTEEDKISLKGAMDVAESTLIGTAGAGAISGAIKGVGALGSKFSKSSALKTLNKALQGIGLKTTSAKKNAAKKISKLGKKPQQWIKEMADETAVTSDINGSLIESSEPLINNILDNPVSILEKAEQKIEFYAGARDSFLTESGVTMNRNNYAMALKASVAGKINVSDIDMVNKVIDETVLFKPDFDPKIGDNVSKIIEEPITALEMLLARKTVDGNINFTSSSNAHKVRQVVREAMNDVTDTVVKSSKGLKPEQKAANQILRNKMSSLYVLKDSLDDVIVNNAFGSAGIAKGAVSAASLAFATGGATGMDPGKLAAVILAMKKASVSQTFNKVQTFGAARAGNMTARLAESLDRVPPKLATRLILASHSNSNENFNKIAAHVEADAALRTNPMSRTTKSILENKDNLIAIARSELPELSPQLEQAFESNNTAELSGMVDVLSKNPNAQAYIAPGMGIDGIVYSPEDKAQLEAELKTDTTVNYIEKLQKLKDLRVNGIIPNAQPEQRVPRDIGKAPRNKDKHDY